MTADGETMKPLRTFATFLILLTLGFVFLNLSGTISTVQAQQIQVTAADPASTAQGTINLNVKVTGKGFKNGAKAKWFVTGTTDPGGVTVNSTTFVNSGELTANITVADTAVIANFDIQVLNSDGRGGKGTELFAVTAKGQPVSCGTDITNLSVSVFKFTDATNTTTYNLWPDLTNPDGSPVPYVSGKSKGSTIDARFQVDNCSYDLTVHLAFSKRFITWKFPAGSAVGTSANATGFNADRVGNVPITDGGSSFLNWCSTAPDNYGGCGVDGNGYFVRRSLGSGIDVGNSSYGNRFQYSPFDLNNVLAVGTAYVKVYHSDANTWTLLPESTSPPPGVTDPNATAGEWSILLNKNTNPITVSSYQKTPFKIVVKKS
jgi:hypothetical protein